jgi:hypothetical protein
MACHAAVSDCGGECVEGDPEPQVSRFVSGDFVVVASQVLDEGVPRGERLSRPFPARTHDG